MKYGQQPAHQILAGRGISIQEVIRGSGLKQGHVYQALQGRVSPKQELRDYLSQLLGLSVSNLFTEDALTGARVTSTERDKDFKILTYLPLPPYPLWVVGTQYVMAESMVPSDSDDAYRFGARAEFAHRCIALDENKFARFFVYKSEPVVLMGVERVVALVRVQRVEHDESWTALEPIAINDVSNGVDERDLLASRGWANWTLVNDEQTARQRMLEVNETYDQLSKIAAEVRKEFRKEFMR